MGEEEDIQELLQANKALIKKTPLLATLIISFVLLCPSSFDYLVQISCPLVPIRLVCEPYN
jgi:hypothetical protein